MGTQASRSHLVGVGGAGMSALARLLLESGHAISGSDAAPGAALEALRALGARVRVGHDAGGVAGAGRIVFSPAIPADNVELRAARAADLPLLSRADALAELLEGRTTIAVAGSHGKSTSGAMLAMILRCAGHDPGWYLGGVSASLDGLNARLAPGSIFVLEACEAFGALDAWRPTHALVTGLDDEHAEHYGGEDGLKLAFQSFVGRIPDAGLLVICGDDAGARPLSEPRGGGVLTYGLEDHNAVRAEVRTLGAEGSVFAILRDGGPLGEVSLGLPGVHNVLNSLGAAAMALGLGVPFETIARALEAFEGVERRWSRVGEAAGVRVFDDFAHHPAQIATAVAAGRAAVGEGGKLVVAFAPQLHSGVPRLARRFGETLSAADLVLLASLVSKDERPGLAAGFEQLAVEIAGAGTPLVRVAALNHLATAALDHLQPGDVLVTLGPDAVASVGAQVMAELAARGGEASSPLWSISRGRTVPRAAPLVDQVLAQATRRPGGRAVECGEDRLTYAELVDRARRMAAALARAGLEPGNPVAVSLERSTWRPVAFLAVLMAGGVYLPVDPALPGKRKRFMARDARANFLVGPSEAAAAFKVDLKVIDPEFLPTATGGWRRAELSEHDPAFVIYTSGTTGRPKGVVIERGSVANFARTAAEAFEVRETSRVSNVSAFGFDVAVGEMAMALGSGACLVIPSETALLAGPSLARVVRHTRVTHLSLTPSTLATLPDHGCSALTHVIVAGEACPPDLAERWGRGRAFFNAYGPTEATVLATIDRRLPGRTITIGRAMDNTCAFILGEAGAPVRPGVAGELWLSGAGLARGYLRRKELTRERFRPVRPDGRKPVRAYRTGDLAAMLPDGRIRYFGRVDDQIKLRGFRVEPGEVEACLRDHPQVTDAVVALRRDAAGTDMLVGYVVPEELAAPPLSEALRQHVAARLPAHMTPAVFVIIDSVPTSPNGKRDRTGLPDPPRGVYRAGAPPKRPAPGIEAELHRLFSAELAIEGEFGVRDSLIELGADSLRTANLFLAIEARFGVELPLEAAARDNTIELLALRIGRLLAEPPVAPDRSLAASLARTQLTYLAAWQGRRRTPESVIVTRGEGGGRSPLFWCFQGAEEHERLAAALGPAQVVHGMRSGHLIFRYTPETIAALASLYVEEVLALQPEQPIFVGGNCQGGIIAQEMVRQLQSRGCGTARLFLIDPGRFPPAAAPVSLMFGSASDLNPYRGGGEAPEAEFEAAYPAGYSVDFLPGAHGLYFEPPGIHVLAKIISGVLARASNPPRHGMRPAMVMPSLDMSQP